MLSSSECIASISEERIPQQQQPFSVILDWFYITPHPACAPHRPWFVRVPPFMQSMPGVFPILCWSFIETAPQIALTDLVDLPPNALVFDAADLEGPSILLQAEYGFSLTTWNAPMLYSLLPKPVQVLIKALRSTDGSQLCPPLHVPSQTVLFL